MARAGKEDVRAHFLMPRLLRDWLALFGRLAGHEPDVELATALSADPPRAS
jgi:hypothetical protein